MTESVNNKVEQVNKEEQPASDEIVTKEPTPVNPAVAKIKDPKKIEAGKKLAAYNKRAKKNKAALKEKNIDIPVDDETTGPGFDITLTTVVAIIGLGLTGVNLYLTHIQKNEKDRKDGKIPIIDYKPVCNLNEKTPPLPPDNGVKDSKNIKDNKGVKKVRFEPGMA